MAKGVICRPAISSIATRTIVGVVPSPAFLDQRSMSGAYARARVRVGDRSRESFCGAQSWVDADLSADQRADEKRPSNIGAGETAAAILCQKGRRRPTA